MGKLTKITFYTAILLFVACQIYNIMIYYPMDNKPKSVVPKEVVIAISEFMEKNSAIDRSMQVAIDIKIPYTKDNELSEFLHAERAEYFGGEEKMIAYNIKIWKFTVEIDPLTNMNRKVITYFTADKGTFKTGTLDGNLEGNLRIKKIYLKD